MVNCVLFYLLFFSFLSFRYVHTKYVAYFICQYNICYTTLCFDFFLSLSFRSCRWFLLLYLCASAPTSRSTRRRVNLNEYLEPNTRRNTYDEKKSVSFCCFVLCAALYSSIVYAIFFCYCCCCNNAAHFHCKYNESTVLFTVFGFGCTY